MSAEIDQPAASSHSTHIYKCIVLNACNAINRGEWQIYPIVSLAIKQQRIFFLYKSMNKNHSDVNTVCLALNPCRFASPFSILIIMINVSPDKLSAHNAHRQDIQHRLEWTKMRRAKNYNGKCEKEREREQLSYLCDNSKSEWLNKWWISCTNYILSNLLFHLFLFLFQFHSIQYNSFIHSFVPWFL